MKRFEQFAFDIALYNNFPLRFQDTLAFLSGNTMPVKLSEGKIVL